MSAHTKVLAVAEVLTGKKTTQEAAAEHAVSVEEVESWRALYLAGASFRPEGRKIARKTRWLAGAAALSVVGLGFIGHAASQDTGCEQWLPAPLATFCSNQPARASDVNENFATIVSWIEAKVGGVSTDGIAATDVVAKQITTEAYTPAYASWESHGTGAGGAAIYNDAGRFGTLMIVGNASSGGPRKVGLWDNVTVSGTLSVGAGLSTGGAATINGPLVTSGDHDIFAGGRLQAKGGMYQRDGTIGRYQFVVDRYVAEAGPAHVGRVMALDQARMQYACADLDGCRVTLAMFDYSPGAHNVTASRTEHLFMTPGGRGWRVSNDAQGVDGDGGLNEWAAWDCYFTDAESTGSGNARADNAVGLGLLNAAGGHFSDSTTGCRLIIED